MALDSYKGRYLNVGQTVKVYRNLNNGRYSIMDCTTGLVLAHADCLELTNVRFIIRKGGLQKARVTGVRNVHAFAEGIFSGADVKKDTSIWEEFTYNPFQTNNFVDCFSGFPVVRASNVYLDINKSFYLI